MLTLPVFEGSFAQSLSRRAHHGARERAVCRSSGQQRRYQPGDDVEASSESLSSIIQRVRQEKFDIVGDRSACQSAISTSHQFIFAGRETRSVPQSHRAGAAISTSAGAGVLEELDAAYARSLLGKRCGSSTEILPPAEIFSLFQTAFLGDAVLTTPLLATLKEHNPGARISRSVHARDRGDF